MRTFCSALREPGLRKEAEEFQKKVTEIYLKA
jgi:hypothetical protein